MEKHFDGKTSAEARRKIVQTQRTIIVLMIIFAVLPFLLAWMSGSLRF